MASSTKKLKTIRGRKNQKGGKARKKKLSKQSTPVFPIHVPDHEQQAK